MISGVLTKELKVNADERGALMEILRSDDEIFNHFGQVYASTSYPGVIRAWHYHQLQDDYFAVVKGMIKTVLYDPREDSPTRGQVDELFMGQLNPVLLRIPRHVIHGYKVIGVEPAILLNFPTEVYRPDSPDEYRLAWNSSDVPYDWAIKFK